MRKTSTKVEILVDVFRQTPFRKFDENLVKIGNIHLGSKIKIIYFKKKFLHHPYQLIYWENRIIHTTLIKKGSKYLFIEFGFKITLIN